jgi:Protein of unknown function (DUF3467)
VEHHEHGEHDEPQDRQLNIHLDAQQAAGQYTNFGQVRFSQYEFTIDFCQIEHEAEGPEVNGVLVARLHMSPRFMRELIDAMEDSWSKWETREGIRNLPETPGD